MLLPRPLGSSAFVLVLGALLAHHSGIEALAPRQPRHINPQPIGWLSNRLGEAAPALSSELVPCDMRENTRTLGGIPSLGIRVAAALRGGRSMRQSSVVDSDEEEHEEADNEEMDSAGMVEGREEEVEDGEGVTYDEQAVEWMMQQLCMYQTRTALISKPLAAKGYKLREIVPSPRGLICALSTEERRMDCRMYVEAEVGKKVVAPCKCKGTQKWISFTALNSERRKETAKWKHCPTCQGPIDYKLYEAHGGGVGKAVSSVLNNVGATRVALGALAGIVFFVVSPVLHAVIVRILTSGVLWNNYHRVNFIIHLPLPLQIMGIRFLMKWTYDKLLALESVLRQSLTDMESQILEAKLPVTVEVDQNGEELPVAHRRP